MLIALGFSMIAVFMYLILTKRLTPTLALVLVPLTFALVVSGTGIGAPTEDGVVDSIMDSIKSFAPTAALLFEQITTDQPAVGLADLDECFARHVVRRAHHVQTFVRLASE